MYSLNYSSYISTIYTYNTSDYVYLPRDLELTKTLAKS